MGHDFQQTKYIESGNECVGYQYYYLSECSRCSQLEPNTGPSTPEWADGIGHAYPSKPPNGQAVCSRCSSHAVEAWYNGYYVHYTLDTTYIFETLPTNGYDFSTVKLWSYSANAYINSGGYEGGSGSEIMIGEEYRVNGAKFRVDLVFSSGYVASNDVTYTD